MVAYLPVDSPATQLVGRICAEFLEMPGLRLTVPQARRLFGLEGATFDMVLAALLDAKFLARTHDGRFVMAAPQM
jgi:hypothetical protein